VAHAHQCPLLYDRGGQTIASHLWIVGKLLSMKEPTTGNRDPYLLNNRLISHVTANCFRKMCRRLRQTVSKRFLDSLNSITTWTFDEAKRGEPTPTNIQNDHAFVVSYLLPTKGDAVAGEIRNLLKQAELVDDNATEWLYTQGSCLEFHVMLLALIKDFTTSLAALEDINRTAKTKGTKDFKTHLHRVIVSGHALQKLAKGAALHMHLQNIEPLLRTWNIHNPMPMLGKLPKERDEDLEAVYESVRKGESLVTTCLDWFRLLVAHFDAVDILVAHVTGPSFPYEDISIEILVAPKVSKEFLPWRDLFAGTILPTPPPILGAPNPTNDDILQFLEASLSHASQFKNALLAYEKGDKKQTIKCLKLLQTSNVTSWVKCAERVLAKLEDKNPLSDFSTQITREIQAACSSTEFFTVLVKTSAFHFSGTLHCEACLASLLTENSLASKDILARMKVSQVFDLSLSTESHFL